MAHSPNLLQRYLWLIDLIFTQGPMTLPEISNAWERSSYNDNKGEPLPQRTFIRHRKAIAQLFGIEISCRKRDNTYLISSGNPYGGNDIISWVVNTLAIEGHLRHNPALRSRIMLDAVPFGEQWLRYIVEAMERNKCIKIEYSAFHDSGMDVLSLEPYCLRAYGRRWYLLGRDIQKGTMDTYGLDRIISLEISGETFALPDGFDAEKFFAEFMGVIINHSVSEELVRIAIDDDFAPHIRNVPLHHTQKEGRIIYPDGSKDATFEWTLRPTPDFLMELYRYGSSLEVLEPQWVRATIAKWAYEHNNLYAGK